MNFMFRITKNMENTIFSMVFIFFLLRLNAKEIQLGVVYSKTYKEGNELYSSSIEGYKNNDFWGIWSVPIGECKSSSQLTDINNITFTSENIDDYDLNTAWMVPNYGIGQCIEFTIDYFPGDNSEAYQFYGICDIFNGYCKSLVLWKNNSRVKKLKVYFNKVPVCYVNLIDTWQFQSFDISKYLLIDKFKNISKSKNILRCEIIEVYKGTKYKDVGFSEFLCEGSAN